MKGTQICFNKVFKAIQHLGDSSSSKTAKDKKAQEDDDSPTVPHHEGTSKHGKWATKCIRAGGRGKAGADRFIKAAKGRTLSQVLSQTSKRLEPPSYAHAHSPAQTHASASTVADHKGPSHSSSKLVPSNSEPPIQILMWIGDQHIDIGKTLVPY